MSNEPHKTDEEKLLTAAYHALRSYQYGNTSPDLAESLADNIQEFLKNKDKLTTA